ncbi:MAG: creatininase family protein [Halodesulfurarchaeum sp.]
MNLAEATWTDADDLQTDLAMLPVGSTEQHGPHDPLGTDALTARAVAEAAADSYEGDVAVAPVVPIGVSEEHRQFTGTLWVSPDTFRAYVRETIQSLHAHGWNRIVIVNGHGGNAPAIGEVAARLSREDERLVVPFTWFDAVETDLDMGHAGPVETSLLLHTHPELVAADRLEAAADGAADRWGEWVSGTNLAHDSAAFTENGTVGDPTQASAEQGERLLNEAAAALHTLLDALRDRDLDSFPHR